MAPGHVLLSSFLLISIVLYFVGLFLYRPSRNKDRWQLPAISYVLALLQIFALLLGLLTFILDYYRVPALLSFMAFSALAYRLRRVDHYYDIRTTPIAPPVPSEGVATI